MPAPAHAQKNKPQNTPKTTGHQGGAKKQRGHRDHGPQRPGDQRKPRDLNDPSVVIDDTTKQPHDYQYKKNERGATLYGPNGIQASDVKQGRIADCFLAASLGAVASAQPDAIKRAIKDNKDGTYTVRFFTIDWNGEKRAFKETVDADLPWDAMNDAPAYAKSTEQVAGKQHMELWPSILEKAYAQWKGTYDDIGHGGSSGDVMEALTGVRSSQTSTTGADDNDALWEKMKRASAAKRPMTAGSGDKDDAKYKDPKAGVYGWHAYTVLGVDEKPGKAGEKPERSVKLRNPWGKRRRDADATAVEGQEGKEKVAAEQATGEFTLSWAEFRRLYDDVTVSG
jgi:hypothetical protein